MFKMSAEARVICTKCVLPEKISAILLDEQGVCSICRGSGMEVASHKRRMPETELIRIFDKFRGKSKYDVLLMCSGGKDSTASLYYTCKRYRLNPLVFTFDNGFEQPAALENIRKSVDILGVDWLYLKSDFMQIMYAEAVRQKAAFPICTLCSLWYMQLTYDVAQRYDLPLMVAGWTMGQMTLSGQYEKKEDIGFDVLCEGIAPFINAMRGKYPVYAKFPKNMIEVQRQYAISRKAVIVSPHWFLPYDEHEYTAVITKELGWKPLDFSYPGGSSNCALNVLGSYMSLRYAGFTHFHVEMSKLIRYGLMTRDEALKKLDLNIKDSRTADILREVLEKLGCADVEL